ncbi:MAG: SseB family protein [Butyrivibrio sp.]|nr:SseB family protein [Butyrivibrio sp.]
MGIMDLFGGKKKAEAEAAEKERLEQEKIEEKVAAQKKAHEGLEWPPLPRLNPVNVENTKKIDVEDRISPERKDEIGNMVFDLELGQDSIRFLNLQELLFLLTTQEVFNKKAPLENYEANHRKLYNEFLNRVRDAEVVYVLYDAATGYPFIDHGYVNMYMDKENAEVAVKLFGQQFRKLMIRECQGEGSSDESSKRGFFDYLYFLGIEHIIVDNGFYRAHFRRSEIAAAPGQWTEDSKLPPSNPALNFAMLDFLGEVRWPVKYEKRPQVIRAKEMRMASFARNARFLVPMQHEGPAMMTEDGKVKLTKDSKIKFPVMKTQNGQDFLPVFTDGIEYAKKFKDGEWQGAAFTFQDILRLLQDKNGIIINPFGQRIVMPKDRMAALEMAAQQAEKAKKAAKKTTKKKATITDFREFKEESEDKSKEDLTEMKDQMPEAEDELHDIDGAPFTEAAEKPIED